MLTSSLLLKRPGFIAVSPVVSAGLLGTDSTLLLRGADPPAPVLSVLPL